MNELAEHKIQCRQCQHHKQNSLEKHALPLSLSPSFVFSHSLSHLLTHSLTHSFTHSLTHSLTLIHSLIHSLSHSLTLTHSLAHSFIHSHSLTHSLSHSLTHTHSHSLTHWLSHSFTHWHTHSHTQSLSVYLLFLFSHHGSKFINNMKNSKANKLFNRSLPSGLHSYSPGMPEEDGRQPYLQCIYNSFICSPTCCKWQQSVKWRQIGVTKK